MQSRVYCNTYTVTRTRTNVNAPLSMFSFSRLPAIHWLMSRMQCSSLTSLRRQCKYNCVSSAKEWIVTWCSSAISARSADEEPRAKHWPLWNRAQYEDRWRHWVEEILLYWHMFILCLIMWCYCPVSQQWMMQFQQLTQASQCQLVQQSTLLLTGNYWLSSFQIKWSSEDDDLLDCLMCLPLTSCQVDASFVSKHFPSFSFTHLYHIEQKSLGFVWLTTQTATHNHLPASHIQHTSVVS